ncbi:hypothetical protein [Cytobacillus firmus]|uniref:hypothetical protein n=1 Tax=Cytobacillus firmus TaxID=1399 RepID=UPI0020C6D886|nr:hypothetical protein [Cytobacillus firmus]
MFENEFRKLWIDHVLWTSNYITSATTAGANLTGLLKEPIVIAGDIAEAAKRGQGAKVNLLNKEWFRNG